MNSIGLLRKNLAKFSSGKILPPNAPCSQFCSENWYGAGFIKKFQTKTCFLGWTKLRTGTLLPPIMLSIPFGQENRWGVIFTKFQTENVFFGKTNLRGLLRQNWAKFSSGTIFPPNAQCCQLGPEKRYGASFVKKFRPKTCFLGWMKLRSGTLLPPIALSSPLGQENWWGAT